MSKTKKIASAVLLLVLGMQLIQPVRNKSSQVQQADIAGHFSVPANVARILKTSCYDCHSNSTRYPWYVNVQPVGWLLARHISYGKAELNFNEFAGYSGRRQLSKLKSIQNSIKDSSMPLSSYTLLHRDAELSEESKAMIIDWTSRTMDSLSKK